MKRTISITEIKNCHTIKLIDNSEYELGKNNNGGCYSYATVIYKNNGKWYVRETTSGEFCPYCGSWDCNGSCHEDEEISESDVLKMINDFVSQHTDDWLYPIECKEI